MNDLPDGVISNMGGSCKNCTISPPQWAIFKLTLLQQNHSKGTVRGLNLQDQKAAPKIFRQTGPILDIYWV